MSDTREADLCLLGEDHAKASFAGGWRSSLLVLLGKIRSDLYVFSFFFHLLHFYSLLFFFFIHLLSFLFFYSYYILSLFLASPKNACSARWKKLDMLPWDQEEEYTF